MLRIDIPEKDLALFCQRWKVVELALFGSVLRADFGQDSDVDVLVTFTPGARWSLFDLVKMEAELEHLIGRKVDLVEKQALMDSPNYLRRNYILRGAEVIYAAG